MSEESEEHEQDKLAVDVDVKELEKQVYQHQEELESINSVLDAYKDAIDKNTKQLEGLGNVIEELNRQQSEIEERAEELTLDRINKNLGRIASILNRDITSDEKPFNRVKPKTNKERRSGEDKTRLVLGEIRKDLGSQYDLVDVTYDKEKITLKPREYLGDRWMPINNALKDYNTEWISEGEDSRWEVTVGASVQKQTQGSSNDDGDGKKQSRYDDWQWMSNNKGKWIFSDKKPELAKRIHKNGGSLEEDGHNYRLYGDENKDLGVPSCIARYGSGN